MINWFDMPAEGLSNGGQFEVKELEVTENGTYEEKGEMYNKVVVNVEGGGGGGSSDFTLASITLSDPNNLGFKMTSAFIPEGSDSISTEFHTNDAGSVNIILYKGSATVRFPEGGIVNTNVTGNATKSGKFITVTGDCTFTTWGESDPGNM